MLQHFVEKAFGQRKMKLEVLRSSLFKPLRSLLKDEPEIEQVLVTEPGGSKVLCLIPPENPLIK